MAIQYGPPSIYVLLKRLKCCNVSAKRLRAIMWVRARGVATREVAKQRTERHSKRLRASEGAELHQREYGHLRVAHWGVVESET